MRSIGLALALACGVLPLAAGLAQEDTSASTVAPLSQPRNSALPWLKLEDLTATRDRPLFALDRRPQPAVKTPPVTAAQQPPKLRPDLALKGVISEGSSKFVLLEDLNTSETHLVRAGERLGDWQVTVDSDRSVTLVGEGEEIKLEMFQDDTRPSK